MEQVIGIFLLTVGCFSSASFYVPSYRIKKWSWETYWISLGFVAWIIMPTVGGLITTPDLWGILRASPAGSMAGAYVFGALWGFGGLMCGLALRHLGLARSVDFARGLMRSSARLCPPCSKGRSVCSFPPFRALSCCWDFSCAWSAHALCGYAGC